MTGRDINYIAICYTRYIDLIYVTMDRLTSISMYWKTQSLLREAGISGIRTNHPPSSGGSINTVDSNDHIFYYGLLLAAVHLDFKLTNHATAFGQKAAVDAVSHLLRNIHKSGGNP